MDAEDMLKMSHLAIAMAITAELTINPTSVLDALTSLAGEHWAAAYGEWHSHVLLLSCGINVSETFS